MSCLFFREKEKKDASSYWKEFQSEILYVAVCMLLLDTVTLEVSKCFGLHSVYHKRILLRDWMEAKRVTKRTVKFRIERFLLINRDNNKYISS